MLLGIKILILIGLIKLLYQINKPTLCAVIYTIITVLLVTFKTINIGILLICITLNYGISFLFFWLLLKFEKYSIQWWLVICSSIFIGMI